MNGLKRFLTFVNVSAALAVCLVASSFVMLRRYIWLLAVLVPLFLWVNIFVGIRRPKLSARRMRILHHGASLLSVFIVSLIPVIVYHALLAVAVLPQDYMTLLLSAVVAVGVLAIVFWNGILSVYCTSYQMGIELRVIGIVCGFFPIVNLVVLSVIVKTAAKEIGVELEKDILNESRKDEHICATKYPILLVHGVFFRDYKFFNYWGRIPKELEKNGAKIYYGKHQSALCVRDSAEEIALRIREIVTTTGCEKVNIIAHSKGGLDCRCAIHEAGAAPYIASLTTVNTPHRGCLFAEKLLYVAPQRLKEVVANTYNAALRKMGDKNPDFIKAVSDLTQEACDRFNAEFTCPDGIFCQSVGSVLNQARSGQFPLNLSYHIVERFDGPNDGLVGEESFAFGERYQLLTVKGERGISHGDMIDLNRENLDEFDVREFYVGLVADLKARGL